MIKKLLFILFGCINIAIFYGQNNSYQHLDTLVMTFVKELQSQNIDTICIYQDYCIGCRYSYENEDDKCSFSSIFIPTYILWYKQGKTFLTKKDNCFDYSTIEIDSVTIWKLFIKHKKKIKKEKVKLFEYLVYREGKKQKFFMLIDHSMRQNFQMIIDGDTTILKFDDFDLKKEDSGYTNINYQHNQNLKGKKIVDELKKLVLYIEQKKILIKNRR